MAITSIFEVQIKPEHVDRAADVLHHTLEDTRARPGSLGVTVFRDHADPAHWVAIERWESIEDDTAYRQWRAGEGAATALRELLAEPPRLTIAVEHEEV